MSDALSVSDTKRIFFGEDLEFASVLLMTVEGGGVTTCNYPSISPQLLAPTRHCNKAVRP